MRQVVVVGGGPAGLAHAFWRRDEPDTEVTVLEAGPRAGGNVRTLEVDGYRCEWGPQAVRPTPAFDEVVDALGCRDGVVDSSSAATQRWIGRGGRLHAAPRGPGSFLRAGFLSVGTRSRALMEPFVRTSSTRDESVGEFVARRFGRGLTPIADAFVSGIFAGDASQLEVASAFPKLLELEREHGSVLRGFAKSAKRARREATEPAKSRTVLQSFRGGMRELADRLAAVVAPRVDAAVCDIQRVADSYRVALEDGTTLRADELVLAIPAWHAADLLQRLDAGLSQQLAAIPSVPVASVFLSAPHEASNPHARGFGFLLDPGEPTPVLGVIFVSELFADAAPSGRSLYRVMIGGARHPRALDVSDDMLRQQAIDAVQGYAGVGDLELVTIMRVPRAIPQYVRGHAARLQRIERHAAALEGLHLIGNSYHGIALGDQLARPAAPVPASTVSPA